MTKEQLIQFAHGIGISQLGVSRAAPSEELRSWLSEQRSNIPPCPLEEENIEMRCDPTLLLGGAKSIVTCLFPYFRKGSHPKQLSRYACIYDYHRVAADKLGQIAAYIRNETGCDSVCCCDDSPLCDRFLAYRAGLGVFGKNHMLINRQFGSYFFIGSVVTEAELAPDRLQEGMCAGCGECVRQCPGGALAGESFDYRRCLSYLTQAKNLSVEQSALLAKQEMVFGCDRCQEVCPHNAALSDTALPEFLQGAMEQLPHEDILTMSGRAFRKKYGAYPFAWRGRRVLERNLLQKELDKSRE